LVETMLALAISAIVMSGLAIMLYQFYSVTRQQQDSLTLNHQLQSAAALLNRDVVGAAAVAFQSDEADKALLLSVPQLASMDDFGQEAALITHTVAYSYSASLSTLSRDDLDDATGPVIVARQVSALAWTPGISNTVELTVTVSTASVRQGEPASRTTRLTFYRRPSD
jgi:Tfp pilus assembly protein PilW